MQRTLSLFLVLVFVFTLSACGMPQEQTDDSARPSVNSTTAPETEASDASPEQDTEPSALETESGGTEQATNILVAYFSWADNAVLDSGVDAITSPSVIHPGNVQQLAGWVQEETGGDLFPIRVTDPYPSDWDACLDRANQERGENARPELAENVENLGQHRINAKIRIIQWVPN